MMCQHCGDAPCETVCPVLRHLPQSRGAQRPGLQPLRGHPLLLEQLPVQGAGVQLLRLRAPEKPTLRVRRAAQLAAQPGRHGAQQGRDGEVHDVRPAHPRGQGDRQGRGPQAAGTASSRPPAPSRAPTRAIVFGDLADPDEQRSTWHRSASAAYWVLEELNTKPGVTYQASAYVATPGRPRGGMTEITYEPAGDPEDVGVGRARAGDRSPRSRSTPTSCGCSSARARSGGACSCSTC